MLRRILINLFVSFLVLLILQTLLTGVGLILNGDNSYMGQADAGVLKLGLTLFAKQIQSVVGQMILVNTLVSWILVAPIAIFFKSMRGLKPIAALLGVLLVCRMIWISVAAVRVPTLFSEIYFSGGTSILAGSFAFLCSTSGLITIGILATIAIVLLGLRYKSRVLIPLASTGLFFSALVFAETWQPVLHLPDKSIVVLMSDSLRYDYFDKQKTPRLWQLHEERNAKMFEPVVPPIARTAPSIVSLLTGKMPSTSGVTTMFSPPWSFDQRDSIVAAYNKAGYCTWVAGEYPAEMFSKYKFGFDHEYVPTVRFGEIILQAVIKKSPFFLAVMSWDGIRLNMRNRRLVNLFEGLPEFASGNSLAVMARRQLDKCGDKPVFGLLFADQPHFPYVQTFPDYLELPVDYRGPYRFMKDAVSKASSQEDRKRVQQLFDASTRAMDRSFAKLLNNMLNASNPDNVTVVVTGDHGETIYGSAGFMGHGDRLEDLDGFKVPWVVFGKDKPLASSGTKLVSTTTLTTWLAGVRNIPWKKKQEFPVNMVPIETGLWMADTPNVPGSRIRYPGLAHVLSMDESDGHLFIKESHRPIIEYAKHRALLTPEGVYQIVPLPDRVDITCPQGPCKWQDLPSPWQTYLGRHHRDVLATSHHF